VAAARQARPADGSAPVQRPVRKGDWVDISNVGQSSFQAPALNEIAAKQLAAGDSALGEVAGILGDVAQLVSQRHEYSKEDAVSQQLQIDASIASVDRVATTAHFDGTPLLDGSAVIEAGGQKIALPAVDSASLGVGDYRLGDLRTGGGLAVASGNEAIATSVVAAAIANMADARTQIAMFKSQAHTTSAADMATTMQSIREMMLGGGQDAVGEGNRSAIVQMLK